ncbi:MAG: hypothetical protein Q9166_007639 [cf. Caloplaca sp. 2 TL-2023]
MSVATYDNFLSRQQVKHLSYCMITLATCFTAIRLGIRAWKRRFWLIEDIIVCLAWACFLAMTIGYICVTNAVYRISEVGSGKKPPYDGLKEDSMFLVKIFFPNTLLLWTTLWLVKFALLLQCRRLIDRRPNYITVWWIIVALTALFYLGCVVTEFTSCKSLHAWFTYGQCWTQRDAKASVVSLFYAFAVDVVTDLMIMVFPLRVLWNLKLDTVRKLSIMAIFGVGIICIITSIIRVAQIHSKAKAKQPSPSWLIVWAVIEASIAVVVACLPTFGLLFPSRKTSAGYDYANTNSQSKVGHRERTHKEAIMLRSRNSQHGYQGPIIEGNASKERLKATEANFSHNAVLVTTTLNVEEPTDIDEDSTHKSSLPEHHAGHMV